MPPQEGRKRVVVPKAPEKQREGDDLGEHGRVLAHRQRLIMKKAWLAPKRHVAKIAQPRGSSCRISAYEATIVSSPKSACRRRMW